MNLAKDAGLTKSQLNQQCIQTFGSVLDYISRKDASTLIESLRQQ